MSVRFDSPDSMTGLPIRVFVYGAPRRAKTYFAGTFPNPVVLSAGQEGGDRTLQGLPNVTVARVNNRTDMAEAVRYIQQNHQARGWRTVVVDSATFYQDLVIGELTGATAGKANAKMDQQLWGQLELHILKWLMPTLHALPLHVVWIALEKVEMNRATGAVIRIEPMLSGATAQKLPATTDLILYADQEAIQDATGTLQQTLVLRTQSTNRAIAGGRFTGAFASGYIYPHFTEVQRHVGHLIGEPMQAVPATGPAT